MRGVTASNTTAVDTTKVFDINYADFGTKLKVWNLITIKLSAAGAVSAKVNTTVVGPLTGTAFLAASTASFT